MKSKKTSNIVLIVVFSMLLGLINGFFGGGGGMLCVPLLENCLHIDNKRAHATAIAVILPITIISSVVYLLSNSLDYAKLSFVALGAMGGGILGAVLLNKLNGKVVRFIFALIMLIAGINMVV